MQALALGSSGDRSNNILWHLDNGWLPKRLTPKVWILMIGTNDLTLGCSKRTVLAGILNVARVLQERRPGTPIVLHGLFPRVDEYMGRETTNFTVGEKYQDILWINTELERFATLHSDWRVLTIGKAFLRDEALDGRPAEINPSLMPDALHPSLEGYKIWAEELVNVIQPLVERAQEQHLLANQD
jgi:lysophospholipase L1-like esterase